MCQCYLRGPTKYFMASGETSGNDYKKGQVMFIDAWRQIWNLREILSSQDRFQGGTVSAVALSITTGPSVGTVLTTKIYRTTSNISRILVGNKIIDNSDVVGAAPTLHLHSQLPRQLQEDKRNILVLGFGATYTRGFTVLRLQLLWSLMLLNVSLPVSRHDSK